MVVVCLQPVAPRPPSRVTFGGTQLRHCSASSGSSRSSTSGSCSSRQCGVLNTGKSFEATQQTRTSSISEVEDFQAFPSQHHSKNTRRDADPGGYKKAKIVRERSVSDESPFIQSATNPSQLVASFEQSLTETDANDDHFWSKVSSPQHEISFVRREDIESPLMGTDGSRSGPLRSSFGRMSDESVQSSTLSRSIRDKLFTGERPSEDSFQRPGSVRCVNSFGAVCTELRSSVTPASNLQQSSVHQRELASNIQTVSSDVRYERSVAGDKTRSNKWWAFVNGIATESSPPGQLAALVSV